MASLLEAKGADLDGSRLLMYSYGSGLAAGMFILRGRAVPGAFALQQLQSKVTLQPTEHSEFCAKHRVGLSPKTKGNISHWRITVCTSLLT